VVGIQWICAIYLKLLKIVLEFQLCVVCVRIAFVLVLGNTLYIRYEKIMVTNNALQLHLDASGLFIYLRSAGLIMLKDRILDVIPSNRIAD
jgi:hypothetical protein